MSTARILGFVALIALLGAGALSAQNAGAVPVADGTVAPGEYATVIQKENLFVYFTITGDTIYAAVVAPTQGWVGLGFGTEKMDGATIFMGYVDGNGTPQFTIQKGRFHMHFGYNGVTPVAHAVGRSAATTTLEVAVPRIDFLTSAQSSLSYIYAYGTTLDFTTKHALRGFGSLPIE